MNNVILLEIISYKQITDITHVHLWSIVNHKKTVL